MAEEPEATEPVPETPEGEAATPETDNPEEAPDKSAESADDGEPKKPEGEEPVKPEGEEPVKPEGEEPVKPEGEEPEKPPDEEEKPAVAETPSGEELNEGEISAIIEKSLEILKFCSQKVDEEKLDSHSLTFMLLRVRENMDSYSNDYLPTLNTFLVSADAITADYYARMCCRLPKLGDLLYGIQEAPTEMINAGGDEPVSKRKLMKLVTTVVNESYVTTMLIKSFRAILKDINNTMLHDRKDIVTKLYTPLPDWLGIQDNVTCQLESIREQTFKISSYLDFLKQGEAKSGPVLDLTPLKEGDKKPKEVEETADVGLDGPALPDEP